jgi:NADH-quinone oxidoreductase subunit J
MTIEVDTIMFVVIAGAGLLTAMAALMAREIVHTIMWLAGFFVSLAMLFFLLLAPFLGILELAVYAGAVTILFLFAVMVVRKRIFSQEAGTGFSVTAVLLTILVAFLFSEEAIQIDTPPPAQSYDINALSTSLFANNGEWVIVLGLIMLSALVGAVYLAREGRERPIKTEGQ